MSRPARHLDTDKKTLDEFLGSGIQQVRVLLRALAIRHLGDGCSATEAAAMVRLTPKAVRALAVRYRPGGLQQALYDKGRPGKKQLLDTPTRQRLTRPPHCA
jgi:transposase